MTAAEATEFPIPAAPAIRRTRPFYWSVRRELWENRSIFMAPLIAAGVVLFGFLLGKAHPPHFEVHGAGAGAGPRQIPAEITYEISAAVIVVAGVIAAARYCLAALVAERRDRTILFWKSLPVSDRTTVLSKLFVPMAAIPAITFVVAVALQLVMLAVDMALRLGAGQGPGALWFQLDLVSEFVVLFYGLIVLALWHAPVWGWLLLVSAWSRRAAFLWAVGPPLAAAVVERLAFGSSHVSHLIRYRFIGVLGEAFAARGPGYTRISVADIDLGKYLSTPGLWVGLVFAAAFIVAAIWLRRRREPL